MRYESLTATQRRTYLATVSGTHHRRVEVELMSLDGVVERDLTDGFLGGSVQGDVSRTPMEVCMFDVFDPDERLDWSNGAHRHHKIRVTDRRFVPDLDEWVDAHAFTGPLWHFTRSGDVVTLTAQGSERLAMGSLREVFHRPRKSKATAVIRDLLSAAGARKRDMQVPSLKARLPESVTVGVNPGRNRDDDDNNRRRRQNRRPRRRRLEASPTEDTYFSTADGIAEALNRDIFADGSGVLVVAAAPKKPSVAFHGATMLAPAREETGGDGERPNRWLVIGANPKGPKPQVRVPVMLDRRHPASAHKMAWHDKPRHVTVRIENRNLRTKKQARELGRKHRDRATREVTTYQVEALPIVPWLRPHALVSVPTSGGRTQVRVTQWTLPLGPGADALTIGANRRRGWK